MPIMDGITATKLIRKDYPELPILAMTANAMAGDREKVIEAGMNDYITKPINVSDMFSTMVKWITPSENVSNIFINESAQHELDETSDHANVEGIPLEFEFIDVNAGLAVSNGNLKLYIKLLGKFVTGQKTFLDSFSTALKNNQIVDATRIAHTLKGSAGNIGAKALLDKANLLETACVNEDFTRIDDVLAVVSDELNNVLDELNQFILKNANNKNSKPAEVKFEPPAEFISAVHELMSLLQEFETDSIDIADELLQQLSGTDKEKLFEKICQHIELYEFTEAEVLLDNFIKNIEE
jgi:polar amino acid transport system substrate-binding protein